MPRRSLEIEQVLSLLAETPARIASLTDGLTPAQLRTAPALAEWSANDVLAHLRACVDVWGGHIGAMLAEEMPTRQALSPRTWIHSTDYRELQFQPSFRAFTAERGALLDTLHSLPPKGWLRSATVVGAGRPYAPTVLYYGQWMARHERTHVKQIARTVATVRA